VEALRSILIVPRLGLAGAPCLMAGCLRVEVLGHSPHLDVYVETEKALNDEAPSKMRRLMGAVRLLPHRSRAVLVQPLPPAFAGWPARHQGWSLGAI
jgi:hypothetical protein